MKKLLAFLVLAVLLAGCDKINNRPAAFQNTDLTGLDYARDFALTDHNGKPRTIAEEVSPPA